MLLLLSWLVSEMNIASNGLLLELSDFWFGPLVYLVYSRGPTAQTIPVF